MYIRLITCRIKGMFFFRFFFLLNSTVIFLWVQWMEKVDSLTWTSPKSPTEKSYFLSKSYTVWAEFILHHLIRIQRSFEKLITLHNPSYIEIYIFGKLTTFIKTVKQARKCSTVKNDFFNLYIPIFGRITFLPNNFILFI